MDRILESWSPIAGYESLYEVSSLGAVRSLDHWVDQANGSRRFFAGKALAQRVKDGGHHEVSFKVSGRSKKFLVHRLVLEAFVGPCPEGLEGCHGDGNPSNNTLSNLRWDTRRENVLDSVQHGTQRNARKTHCPQGHEYTPENTHTDKLGKRNCRTCDRDTYHARKAAAA